MVFQAWNENFITKNFSKPSETNLEQINIVNFQNFVQKNCFYKYFELFWESKICLDEKNDRKFTFAEEAGKLIIVWCPKSW